MIQESDYTPTPAQQKSIDEMKERNRQIWIEIAEDKKRKAEKEKENKKAGKKKDKSGIF